jgi:hypothetical protein
VKASPAVTLIHSVTGPVDLIVRIEAENVAGIEAARAALDALPEIAELSTYVVLERHLG